MSNFNGLKVLTLLLKGFAVAECTAELYGGKSKPVRFVAVGVRWGMNGGCPFLQEIKSTYLEFL